LAGGLEDEDTRAALLPRHQAVHDGEQERGRLAGARLRAADHVPSVEHGRDRLRLDRGRVLEAELLHGLEQRGVEAEGLKARQLRDLVVAQGFVVCVHEARRIADGGKGVEGRVRVVIAQGCPGIYPRPLGRTFERDQRMKTPQMPQMPKMPNLPKLPKIDRKWLIIGGVSLVVVIVAIVILTREKEDVVREKPKVVENTGPDPRIAKIAGFAKQSEEFEAKGEYKDALWYLDQIAKLDPADPRVAQRRPGLAEKVKRIEAWEKAQQQAESERKEAQRLNTAAAWKKVVDAAAEAEKLADTDKQRAATTPVSAVAKRFHAWAAARDEDKKANLTGALDLVGQAIGAGDAPPELSAYKADLEKRKKKQDFDRAASAASKEGVPAKAYELWQAAKAFAEDPKDVADVDAKLFTLKAKVDPAERDKRYAELIKAGDTALAAGEFDAAEKAYKEAQGLKGTDLAAGQAIIKVNAARRTKDYDAAMAAAKAAEAKKDWSDVIDAYDKALRVMPGDLTATSKRKEVEDAWRPAKLTLMVGEPPDVKMDFVLIKRGKFMMGDASGNSDEKVHEVVIEKDFYMQTTELTQA